MPGFWVIAMKCWSRIKVSSFGLATSIQQFLATAATQLLDSPGCLAACGINVALMSGSFPICKIADEVKCLDYFSEKILSWLKLLCYILCYIFWIILDHYSCCFLFPHESYRLYIYIDICRCESVIKSRALEARKKQVTRRWRDACIASTRPSELQTA